MESGSPERASLTYISLVTACITSRKKEDKNYFSKACLYSILCIKFFRSQLLIYGDKNVAFLLVQVGVGGCIFRIRISSPVFKKKKEDPSLA